MSIKSPYTLLGLGLILIGVLLSFVSYFVLSSIPLTALGISSTMIGTVSLALGRGHPKTSPQVNTILFESGLENISAIIEELGLRSKAIYLPSSLTSGRPQALLPLHLNPYPPKLEKPLPKRLVVKYGPNLDDMGLLITTSGSIITSMLGSKPSSAQADLEAALSSVLAGVTNLADSIRVTVGVEGILVEVSKPRLECKKMLVYECLGSPLASMVASIVAETLDKAVIVEREEYDKGKGLIELKVLW